MPAIGEVDVVALLPSCVLALVEPRLQIGDHAPQQIVDDLGTRRVSLFLAKLADGDNEVRRHGFQIVHFRSC